MATAVALSAWGIYRWENKQKNETPGGSRVQRYSTRRRYRVLGTQSIPDTVPKILRFSSWSALFFQIVHNARRSRSRVGALAWIRVWAKTQACV